MDSPHSRLQLCAFFAALGSLVKNLTWEVCNGQSRAPSGAPAGPLRPRPGGPGWTERPLRRVGALLFRTFSYFFVLFRNGALDCQQCYKQAPCGRGGCSSFPGSGSSTYPDSPRERQPGLPGGSGTGDGGSHPDTYPGGRGRRVYGSSAGLHAADNSGDEHCLRCGALLAGAIPSVAPLHACLWASSILIHPCTQVEHTTTGESAWDLLSSRRFDIALVDVKLPGITGLDLSWCYASSFSEGVTVHDTIMIACTSEIDPAALYEHATPVTRGPSPRRRRPAVACRLATRPPPAPLLPRRRQRCFCALLPAHTPLTPPRAGMASRTC